MNSLVLPMALSIAGALVYVLATNAKLVEIGRIVFFCAFFWLVYSLAGLVLRF